MIPSGLNFGENLSGAMKALKGLGGIVEHAIGNPISDEPKGLRGRGNVHASTGVELYVSTGFFN
ncbi:MAG: hypothetical protein ACI9QC_000612 [Oceanicoccus sp.]|jgi:hypothetical protein